jgi:hypothetical protein
MLHACVTRFDVMFWGEIFWELNTPSVSLPVSVHAWRQHAEAGRHKRPRERVWLCQGMHAEEHAAFNAKPTGYCIFVLLCTMYVCILCIYTHVHALLLLLLHALALHRAEEKRSHTQEDHSVSLSSYLHMDDDDDTTAMRSWLCLVPLKRVKNIP